MTEQARIYGTVLAELRLPEEMIGSAGKILADNPELAACLTSPAVPSAKKKAVIRRVFSEPDFSGQMIRFLEKVCENGCMDELDGIIQVWRKTVMDEKGILEARLEYVSLPDEEQLAGIKDFLCRRLGKKHVQLELKENPELLDGFILQAGDMEYDCSLRGQLAALTRAVAG